MELSPRPLHSVLIVNTDQVLQTGAAARGADTSEHQAAYGEGAGVVGRGLCPESMINLQRVLTLSGAGVCARMRARARVCVCARAGGGVVIGGREVGMYIRAPVAGADEPWRQNLFFPVLRACPRHRGKPSRRTWAGVPGMLVLFD